jgi:hypothetical protein
VNFQVNYRHQNSHVATTESCSGTGKSNAEMKVHNFAFEHIHLMCPYGETQEE